MTPHCLWQGKTPPLPFKLVGAAPEGADVVAIEALLQERGQFEEQCARGTAKLTRAPENRHNSERVDFAQTVQRSLNESPSFHAKCRVYST